MTCGPCRNLTGTFFKVRADQFNKKGRFGVSLLGPSPSSSTTATEGQQRLLAGEREPDRHPSEIEMTSSLPPLWVDLVEEAQEEIGRLKDKLGQLERVQKKRLLKVFGDDANCAEVDVHVRAIQDMFRRCETLIQQIETRGLPLGDVSEDTATSKIRKNAQRAVASQLQALTQQFKRQQRSFAEQMERLSGKSATSIFAKSSNPDAFFDDDAVFSRAQLQEVESWDQEAEQRNEEISKIAKSVTELSQIFKEVAVLVIDQGTLLDRIDYNVEQVVERTETARTELVQADQRSKNTRVTKVIFGLLIAIGICILLLIIKTTSKSR
eukprot:GDKH01013142.1.p1 GENE.GDKH01013142.1~~GDKH01013142.1.p1  ORF type:complete len:324 (-),score=38.31 GDKH01013142.1:91-1062(-)